MSRAKITLLLLALFTFAPARTVARKPEAAPAPDAGAVGINLARASHWSSSQPFVDAIRVADDWVSGTVSEFRDGREIAVDEHGWIRKLEPGQVARMVILGDEAVRPVGTYTFVFEGKGAIRFDGAGKIVERKDGRMKVEVAERGVLLLVVSSVDPKDPLRNLRLFYPGGRCEGAPSTYCTSDAACGERRCVPFEENADEEPFHPTFLEEIAPFSVLRFLDWMDANRELDDPRPFPERFDDWPTPRHRRYHPVPFEIIAKLANRAEADPWLTLPPLASDDLYRKAFRVMKRVLAPERKVYVELGNELWNDIFRQYHAMNAAGCLARSSAPTAECDPDGNGILCEPGPWDEMQARCRIHGLTEQAARSAKLFAIAREEFGPGRVVRVLAGQFGAFDTRGGPMLETVLPDGSRLADHVDVYAVAPYFGTKVDTKKELAGVFERTRSTIHGAPPGTFQPIAGKASAPWGGPYSRLQSDVRALRAYPRIRIAAYEGGPHFVGYTDELAREVARVNRDPRMKALYASFLELWDRATGGALFLHYASSNAWGRHGAWGVKEYQGQPVKDAPKYDALLDYIEKKRGARAGKAR